MNNLNVRSALSESLRGGKEIAGLSSTHDNLDLDGAVIDEKAVQFLEGLASASSVAEGHVGDAPALRVGAVHQLDLLDGTDGLNKVFLRGTRLVTRFEIVAFAAKSTSFSIDPVRRTRRRNELDKEPSVERATQ